ncbi:MAG TPA: hypothetical protein VEJ63_09015 [Planctomycetota bacterium]|nr:hypothetical protein [Planctomycetota bacterium]
MGKGGGATCECGQVLFEIAGRKDGDKLTCPWCQRQYRYLGGEKIELIGTADEMEARAAEEKKKKAEKKEEREHKAEKPEKKEKRSEPKKEAREVKEVKKERQEKEPPKHSGRETRREEKVSARQPGDKEKKKKGKMAEIPGGTPMMIVFIIAFVVLAFVALALVMPTGPNKMRYPIWGGEPVSGSATWPLIVAMVIGHIVGFIAWSIYVYQLQKVQQLERKTAELDEAAGRRER